MKKLLLLLTIFCINMYSGTSVFASQPFVVSDLHLSVVDGRVFFQEMGDFLNTVDFLNKANEKELLEFRNSFELETPGKNLTEFENRLQGVYSQEELINLENSFSEKITINAVENEKEYDLKYKFYEELVNMEGIFQIGQNIIKVTKTKVISITQPDKVNLSEIGEETQTDVTVGLYVVDAIIKGDCCPSNNTVEKTYTDGKESKRLTANYEIFNLSIILQVGNETQFSAQIAMKGKGWNDRKKWPGFWGCSQADLTLDLKVTFTHSYSKFGLVSPVTLSNFNATINNGCTINVKGGTKGALFQVGPGFKVPEPNICVKNVSNVLTHAKANVVLTDKCIK